MNTFSKALEALKEGRKVRRSVIKNDDFIISYKNRLYWLNHQTGVRYPYHPSDKDLMANDWNVIDEETIPKFVIVASESVTPLYHYQCVEDKQCFGVDFNLAFKFHTKEDAMDYVDRNGIECVNIEEHSY